MGDINAIGNAAGASPATETYGYDPLYRLTGITDSGTALETYTYNKTGDRLSKVAPGLATGTYSYTTNTHQLIATGNAARTNDANGNTTGSTVASNAYGFGYNDRNRLVSVLLNGTTLGTYSYNALGQRIQKVTSATERYSYDEANHLVGEYGGTNRDYVWMGSIPVAIVDVTINGGTTTSVVNYVHADHLNTPRAVANSAGTVIWAWAFKGNPFGEQQPISSSGYILNLRYPGQYYDAESGVYYNLFRNYDPTVGRYIQSDPLGLTAGVSTYSYTGGNPFIGIDPLGLAFTYSFSYSITLITPGASFSASIGAGFTLDGLNSTGFDQAQLNVAAPDASHGIFAGAGPQAQVADAPTPTTGISSAPYTEADGAVGYGGGGSATLDDQGNIDWAGAEGPKGGVGAGAGSFSGTSYTATLAGPSLGTLLNDLSDAFNFTDDCN
jgi:RHS repeat-associated protein